MDLVQAVLVAKVKMVKTNLKFKSVAQNSLMSSLKTANFLI